MNKKGVRKLYSENTAAKAILDHLASRSVDRRKTTVDRFQTIAENEGVRLSRADVVEALKEFERLGCGHFLVGRKGHPSRFEAAVSMISVGQYAAAEREDIEAAPDSEDETDDVEMRGHAFQLRRDLVVRLELPIDLSRAEAARLATFVQALPLGAE